MRKIKFQNEHYYHILNHGVDKRDVFLCENDYYRFLLSLREFNRVETEGGIFAIKYNRTKTDLETESLKACRDSVSKSDPLVEIIAYCLNPNHFHLLIKQLKEKGISKFMHKVGLGYTSYINKKNNRTGVLFQGPFQAVEVKTNEQLLYLSAYINGNSKIHNIQHTQDWKWSSCPDFLGKRNGTMCNKNNILKQFKDISEYENYLNTVIKESKKRKEENKNYYLET